MNLGITIARKGSTFKVIATPDVPFSEQRRNFRKLRVELVGEADEVQLWSSSQGRVKRKLLGAAQVETEAKAAGSSTEGNATPVAAEKKPVTAPKADPLAKARAAAAAKKAKGANPLE